jgi:uncharacterized protein (TIGR03435 family)
MDQPEVEVVREFRFLSSNRPGRLFTCPQTVYPSGSLLEKTGMVRKVVTAIFLIAAARMACPPSQAAAQNQAAQIPGKPSFDVVSIHEWKPGPDPYSAGMQVFPDRILDQCANLHSLLFFAFHLTPQSPIEGLPAWAGAGCGVGDQNAYKIEATMPVGTTEDQAREMMQTLLAERFKLTVHWQKKMAPAYALVLAPGGFKLKPYDPKDPPNPAPGKVGCPSNQHCANIFVRGPTTVSDFAKMLGMVVGRQVVDKAGVTGTYYVDNLMWADNDTPADSTLPSLPTLLREQFGLELKPETAPVDVLVIDHVEKPTPN